MKTKSILLLMTLSALVFFNSSCKKDDDEDPPISKPTYTGDASKGGIMFDKFWSKEAGFDQNDANIATLNENSNFFRCKQCHGWDGLGNNGAYIDRGPKVDRPNVTDFNIYLYAQAKTVEEIHKEMGHDDDKRDISYDLSTYDPETNSDEGDKMPDLTQLLTDNQMWDLAKFLKEGMFDVSELYDATYTGEYPTGSKTFSNIGKGGNAAKGLSYYNANCAGCHGNDGTKIDLEGKTIGKFIRTKGNEAQHKVKYGQLGSPMVGQFEIALAEMKDLYKACADTIGFPD